MTALQTTDISSKDTKPSNQLALHRAVRICPGLTRTHSLAFLRYSARMAHPKLHHERLHLGFQTTR